MYNLGREWYSWPWWYWSWGEMRPAGSIGFAHVYSGVVLFLCLVVNKS